MFNVKEWNDEDEGESNVGIIVSPDSRSLNLRSKSRSSEGVLSRKVSFDSGPSQGSLCCDSICCDLGFNSRSSEGCFRGQSIGLYLSSHSWASQSCLSCDLSLDSRSPQCAFCCNFSFDSRSAKRDFRCYSRSSDISGQSRSAEGSFDFVGDCGTALLRGYL